MGNPTLPPELAAEAVRRVEEKYREGYRPKGQWGETGSAVEEAARQAVADGWVKTPQSFQSRLRAAARMNLAADETLYRPQRYQQPVPKLILLPAAEPPLPHREGKGERILVIPDLHQDPRHPHRLQVLTWIARYASEHRIPRIVQLGDWSTNDSVSTHDKPDSRRARLKPQIKDDLENLVASHQAFERGRAADYKPKRVFLQGNHEYRFERFEDANPQTHETYTLQRDQTFAQFGWQSRPYGEIWYCQSVGFTHHPTNAAGKAYGGKTGPQRAANDTTVALVSGHTHKRQLYETPKTGLLERLTMIEGGCALPWGETETYIGVAPHGWWWGIVDLFAEQGEMPDVNFKSMRKLRSLYSDDGGDIRSAA